MLVVVGLCSDAARLRVLHGRVAIRLNGGFSICFPDKARRQGHDSSLVVFHSEQSCASALR